MHGGVFRISPGKLYNENHQKLTGSFGGFCYGVHSSALLHALACMKTRPCLQINSLSNRYIIKRSLSMFRPPHGRPKPQKLKLTIPQDSPEASNLKLSDLTSSSIELFSDGVPRLSEKEWVDAARSGQIEKIRFIGEGSGGTVQVCRLKTAPDSTPFALKEISANPGTEVQKQVLRELQFNRTCDSPYIVKYYGAYLIEEVGSIYIAMEYCSGQSLDDISKQVKKIGGRIGEKVLGRIAYSVLEGISYLYDRNIIHRDIKPQNILINEKGEVKLCDFGVSGEVVNSLATTFTGTSSYMAPERIQGEAYTVSSDVWSLGLTLMELAMGYFPFEHKNPDGSMFTPIELYLAIVNNPVPELRDENGVVWSASFRHFLKCCLEKDPTLRPTPKQLLSHPWVVASAKKPVNMIRFISEAWGFN